MAGIDSNTLLMLHGDGSDGGTTFTDSSSGANTPTVIPTITTSTTTQEFGTASIKSFDSGYLEYGAIINFPVDFTVDFWFNFNALPTGDGDSGNLFGTGGNASCGVQNYDNTQCFRGYVINRLGLYYMEIGGRDYNTLAAAPIISVSNGAWHHYAFVRTSGQIKFFFDGVQKGTDFASSFSFAIPTFDVMNHTTGVVNSYVANGYMDEFRVSNVARWTTNFTPPTSAYSLDATNIYRTLMGVGS